MPEPTIERGLGERIARTIRDIAGPPPVDLEALAGALGVEAIRYTDLTEDGRTTWVDGKPHVDLRSDRPAARTRFTLAHEIGHILIDADESVAHRTHGLAHDDIETLCDWIAASILMPREWVSSYARRERYTLSLLRVVAHRADVSLAAAAVRMAEVGGRTCMLLRWTNCSASRRSYEPGMMEGFSGDPDRTRMWNARCTVPSRFGDAAAHPLEVGPGTRRAHPLGWALTCGFVGGGGRI